MHRIARILQICLLQYPEKLCLRGGSRISEREANHSSGSLKQGVWGSSPPEAIGYFVL